MPFNSKPQELQYKMGEGIKTFVKRAQYNILDGHYESIRNCIYWRIAHGQYKLIVTLDPEAPNYIEEREELEDLLVKANNHVAGLELKIRVCVFA